jgi:putative serine protease PepD
MNEATPTQDERPPRRRFGRRGLALAAAAAVGAAASAGIVTAVDGGSTHTTTVAAPTATRVVTTSPAAIKATALSAAEIYRRDAAGVVDITVSGTSSGVTPFGGPQQSEGEGSGFVIDKKGDIVTNAHVVEGANSITVEFTDGTKAKAKLVGSDVSSDLAVIHVDLPAGKLTPLVFGDSSAVVAGDPVVAIGSPFGEAGSITAGIVSAVGREIQAPNGTPIENAIQTDAAINHGNSGGPLISMTGDVIGVNAQIASDSNGNNGVGFALSSNSAKSVVAQLIAGKTVKHAFLGVGVATASNGVKVTDVQTGTPAASAGLKTGDVITAFDGTAVKDSTALRAAIAEHAPGDKVKVTVLRAGATHTVSVALGNRPSS